jgi:hypothetical protein
MWIGHIWKAKCKKFSPRQEESVKSMETTAVQRRGRCRIPPGVPPDTIRLNSEAWNEHIVGIPLFRWCSYSVLLLNVQRAAQQHMPRQVQSLFQSEVSTQRNLVRSLSTSNTFSFIRWLLTSSSSSSRHFYLSFSNMTWVGTSCSTCDQYAGVDTHEGRK